MDDCIFCRIAEKELPSALIGENEGAVAFLDVHPLAPGHTLVVPKKHYETILDLPRREVGNLALMIQEAARLLSVNFKAPALTIGTNQGRIAGQVASHLHIHLLPRFPGDGGGSIHTIVRNEPKEALEEIRKRIVGEGFTSLPQSPRMGAHD